MVYRDCKVYGPYKSSDNRERVIIIRPDKSKTTVSYPKYLMETHLNRYLDPNLETIDHIDNNFNNNNLSNLRIISRDKHVYENVIRIKSQDFICSICNKPFTLSGKKLNDAVQNKNSMK